MYRSRYIINVKPTGRKGGKRKNMAAFSAAESAAALLIDTIL
jgi:hypothetical protein